MKKAAFTLIELLAVMTIIIIIVGVVVPPLVTTMSGSQLTQATQQVIRQLDLARQTALSQNRMVEVRFYKYADSAARPAAYQAYQAFLKAESGSFAPLSAIQKLPPSVLLNTSTKVTSFIGTDPTQNVVETIVGKNGTDPTTPNSLRALGYNYFKFQFRPDGSTNLTQYNSVDTNSSRLWYFTLNDQNASGTPPTNYATIQVDPVNGDTRLYRP